MFHTSKAEVYLMNASDQTSISFRISKANLKNFQSQSLIQIKGTTKKEIGFFVVPLFQLALTRAEDYIMLYVSNSNSNHGSRSVLSTDNDVGCLFFFFFSTSYFSFASYTYTQNSLLRRHKSPWKCLLAVVLVFAYILYFCNSVYFLQLNINLSR